MKAKAFSLLSAQRAASLDNLILSRTPTYLEGKEALVTRLIIPITHIVTLIVSIINLLTKPP